MEYLCSLVSAEADCRSARDLLPDCIESLAEEFDTRLPEVAWTSDPTEARLLDHDVAEKRKRRRLDEDFKHAVATQVVVEGRAKSSHAYLRSKGDAVSSASSAWEEQAVMEMQAASWLSFAGCQSLGFCIDGSRTGQPARETEYCYLFNLEKHCGTWAPPQAGVTPVLYSHLAPNSQLC